VHRFSKNLGATSKFKRRKGGDTKQVPHWGPKNITSHLAKFGPYGNLAKGICAPLPQSIVRSESQTFLGAHDI